MVHATYISLSSPLPGSILNYLFRTLIMGCPSTTVKAYTWHVDMDSILETFKFCKTGKGISDRNSQSTNRRDDVKELTELVQNAPPEDIFSLLVAGDLIDWTVLQHMHIIARSPPTAKLGERLYPTCCACVEQGNKEENRTIKGKRKRKRKGTLARRRSVEASKTEVSLSLSLDDIIALEKRYGDTIQRLSACQAGLARRTKPMGDQGARSTDYDLVWAEHQAYLDDVRELAVCAKLKSLTEFRSRDCGELEVEKYSENKLQEENRYKKRSKRSSADQEISLANQAVRDGKPVISKKQEMKLSKEKKKMSIAKIKSKQLKSKQKNTSNLIAQDADNTTRENGAMANKPDQSAEEVFGMNSMNTDYDASLVTAVSTPLRRSSRKSGANHVNAVVSGRISHSNHSILSTKKATNETSVKSNISLSKSGYVEPKLENQSRLLDINHQNRSQSDSALQPESVSNDESDTSDINNLASCPSSLTTPVSTPTPGSRSPIHEAAKANNRSNSKSIISAACNDSKDSQRSSFCLQYMKPRVAETAYGLIQEALVDDPFDLLVAVTLLNRTKGTVAVPIFFTLMAKFSTPKKLAAAPVGAIVAIIGRLGLQNNRAKSLIGMARRWSCDDAAPRKGYRYRTLHYPYTGAGSNIRPGEVIADEVDDPREGAFEIGHLPGVGPYALDSWRIFCRDMLRGLAKGYNGEGAEAGSAFEPEWKRVLPKDKELRGFLKWMWAKEGMEWDPLTGDKRRM